MTRKRYEKSKGRATHASFVGIPKNVVAHRNFIRLTSSAQKLIIDLGFQYNGFNNGDLTAAFSVLKKRGWRSKETLANAIACAINYGMIMVTRRGGKNLTTLYALTWNKIDECKGKLDVTPTNIPPGLWKEDKPDWKPKDKTKSLVRKSGQVRPNIVPMNIDKRGSLQRLPRKSY